MSLMTPMTEILPRLWVGTQLACEKARERGWSTLCVLESECHGDCRHMRIAVTEGPLGIVSHVEDKLLQEAVIWVYRHHYLYKEHVLVHCAAGMERSPLVLAHYLVRLFDLDLDKAYDWLQRHRPQVQDRRAWVKQANYQWPDQEHEKIMQELSDLGQEMEKKK